MKELIMKLGEKVKNKQMSWREAAREYNKETKENITADALRMRYYKYEEGFEPQQKEKINEEYETHNQDGSIDICKKIWFDKNENKTPDTILEKFGYDKDSWEVVSWTFGKWEVAIKNEEQNRVCTTIRARIRPRQEIRMPIEKYVEVAKDVFSKEITPLKANIKEKDRELNDNKLLELTGIELHLGKMAWSGETGQDYDKNIAQDRFNIIYKEILKQQEIEQCDTCLICIGNDFFNSDTIDTKTSHGTQQTNDLRWQKLFNIGLKLYTEMILGLSEKFNNIDIRLQSGNHDKMATFYLYIALSCYFKDFKNIHFSKDYKDVQCYLWGKCGIFFSHGDTNLKRLIKSIPAEFYEEWGKTTFRELHLGHLHKEVVVDDESGMITRRVGSPSGTDQWHYSERFIGATQKYQTFVWHKEKGLQNIKYINFDSKKKQKVRRLIK